MSSNSKLIIFGSLFFVLIAVLVIMFIPEKLKYYWFGLFLGTIFGLLTALYMVWNKVIDPTAAKSTFRERVESPWIIISVAGGMIIARILFRFIPSHLEVLLLTVVSSWIALTFGYLAFKVWRIG